MGYNDAVSDSYYQEQLKQIETWISQQAYQKAYDALHEELSMPYVPKAYQDRFESLFRELKQTLQQNQPVTQVIYTQEELMAMFQGDIELQLKALNYLDQQNLRTYHELIQRVFDQVSDPLIQNLLIVLTIQQQLTHEFVIEREGINYRFIPASLVSPLDCEAIQMCKQSIHDYLEKEPSLIRMAHERLDYYALEHLPLSYDESEVERLMHQVMYDVYHAMQMQEAWLVYQTQHQVNLDTLSTH